MRSPVRSLSGRRRLFDFLGWVVCAISFSLLAAAMVWIVAVVFSHGAGALAPKLFTEVTQGTGGGLLNAIEGTAVLAFGGVVLAVPLGVAAGI